MSGRRWTDESGSPGYGEGVHPSWALREGERVVALADEDSPGRWSVYLPHHRDDNHRITFQGTEAEAKGFTLHLLAWYERDQRRHPPALERLLGVVRAIVEAGSERGASRQLVELVEAFEDWQRLPGGGR